MKIKFNRVLLKISGEALMGKLSFGIDPSMLEYVSKQIKPVVKIGIQLSIVVGGGNIFRGIKSHKFGIERSTSDHIGMLATVINSLALQDVLKKNGINSIVQSAIPIKGVAETYVLNRSINYLEKGMVVIFAAGIGNPYFTTDTAAVLRAIETYSDIVLKATKVDGLYDSDPELNLNAKLIKSTNYMEVIIKQLKAMDMTAIALAMNNDLPLIIFNIKKDGDLKKILCGKNIGTKIANNNKCDFT